MAGRSPSAARVVSLASISKEINDALFENGLCSLGGFASTGDDTILGPDCRTLVMVGPDEPRFWSIFSTSAEYMDGAPDPMDRWSYRVLTQIAKDHGLSAHFPFGGPPFAPFYQWALKTGRVFASPIRLLVHDTAGLFVSFRGALALPYEIVTAPSHSPCLSCAKPCLSTCPVTAFANGTYDTVACTTEIQTRDRGDCLDTGCAARRACPISAKFGRLNVQSQFHMRDFVGLK